MTSPTGEIAQCLERTRDDAPRAAEELLPLVYDELRKLARVKLSRMPPGQTVRATELVHEAWMRVVADGDPGWDGRAHFFGAAARAMRNILVEQIRRKHTIKRDVSRKEVLETDVPDIRPAIESANILAVHENLDTLALEHARPAKVVELKFFGGLSMPEVAEVLGASLATIERDWRFARAWLQSSIDQE